MLSPSPMTFLEQIQMTTDHCQLITVPLLRFLVRLMLAATVTELLELETAGGRLLVLSRRVVPVFAFLTLERNDVARH